MKRRWAGGRRGAVEPVTVPKEASWFLRDRMQDRITFLSNKRDLEGDMANMFIAPLVLARTTIDKMPSPDLYA
jgi:phosphoenolpyruvate carboxykinase (ATP)